MPPDNRVRPVSTRLIVHRPAKKYANSKMTVEERAAILDAVQRVMDQRKPFLNPELNIDELASLVNCSRHRLSQALNETLDQSFYDFVNHHRVEQAMQLLTDESREAHKISSIAYDAGFNSLSTFNDVFKKVTGLTPSQYKKGARPVSKQERG
jgi:AraC-like DNA-binding protein